MPSAGIYRALYNLGPRFAARQTVPINMSQDCGDEFCPSMTGGAVSSQALPSHRRRDFAALKTSALSWLQDIMATGPVGSAALARECLEIIGQLPADVVLSGFSRHIVLTTTLLLELRLSIPLVHGRPLVMVQDSKHSLKTARNQLFSGARVLSLGNDAMFYSLIRDLANHPSSPLFRRDVENVDRQSDHAASRLFSAEVLEQQAIRYPKRLSVTLYLFFIGGLFDAWQNRKIGHGLRVLLALRCRFFLQAWRAHVLAHPEHSLGKNYISRESDDIFHIVCESLVSLIVSYRDYYPESPLLPWLHSTEPEEHVFGVTRFIKENFNYADFLHAVPKICAFLMGDFVSVSASDRANISAAGYWHTWADTRGLDVEALSQWPSDAQLETLSARAFADVKTILRAVGIRAERLMHLPRDAKPARAMALATADTVQKPQKKSTAPLPRRELPKRSTRSLARNTGGLLYEWLENERFSSMSEMVAERERLGIDDPELGKELDVTAAAYAAADLHATDKIMTLPDTDERHISQNAAKISAFTRPQKTVLPAMSKCTIPPPLFAESETFSLEKLVQERRVYQNHFTSEALRKGTQKLAAFEPASTEMSLTRRLKCKFGELISKAGGNSAGYGRLQRWTGGAASDEAKVTLALAKRVEKYGTARRRAFTALGKIHRQMDTGNVNALLPLLLSDQPSYAAIWMSAKPGRIAFGEVRAVYTLNSRRHASLDKVETLGALSYMTVRVYTRLSETSYTSIGTPLSTATFAHVPPSNVLFVFSRFKITRTEAADGSVTSLTLSAAASSLLEKMEDSSATVQKCVKGLRKQLRAQKEKTKDGDESGTDDDFFASDSDEDDVD